MALESIVNRTLAVAFLSGVILLSMLVVSADAAGALPAIPLRLFTGGTLDLQSLAGRVVVLRFAASW
jgi:hypothetical protein